MLKTLRNKIVILLASLTMLTPMAIPVQSFAASTCNNIGSHITTGIQYTSGSSSNFVCGQGGSITSGISSLAVRVVNLFSIIVGIVSVIMIIYAGFRYVTSGGESNSISSAKNTLIYAIIGLVVVVLSQLIVHYVLNTATSVAAPSGL